jgi:hypothetical protein
MLVQEPDFSGKFLNTADRVQQSSLPVVQELAARTKG